MYEDNRAKMIPEPALEPEEPAVTGHCAWCGDEIYEGELVFSGDEGQIHVSCMLPMLEEKLGVEYLAVQCGYEEVTA